MLDLHAEHAAACNERAAALMALSMHVFNRPDRHSRLRDSEQFRRWLACSDRLRALQAQLDECPADSPATDSARAEC
jgi:hypothetical protein